MALTNLAPQDQQILEKINALRDYSSDEIGTTAFDKFHIANIKPFLEATTTPKLTRIFQLAVDDPKNYIKKCLDEWRQHKAQQAAQAKMKDKSLLLRVNKNVPVTVAFQRPADLDIIDPGIVIEWETVFQMLMAPLPREANYIIEAAKKVMLKLYQLEIAVRKYTANNRIMVDCVIGTVNAWNAYVEVATRFDGEGDDKPDTEAYKKEVEHAKKVYLKLRKQASYWHGKIGKFCKEIDGFCVKAAQTKLEFVNAELRDLVLFQENKIDVKELVKKVNEKRKQKPVHKKAKAMRPLRV